MLKHKNHVVRINSKHLTAMHGIDAWTLHYKILFYLTSEWATILIEQTTRMALGYIIANTLIQITPLVIPVSAVWHLTTMSMGIMQTILTMATVLTIIGHTIMPSIIIYTITRQKHKRHKNNNQPAPTWTLAGQNPMYHSITADIGGIHSIKANLQTTGGSKDTPDWRTKPSQRCWKERYGTARTGQLRTHPQENLTRPGRGPPHKKRRSGIKGKKSDHRRKGKNSSSHKLPLLPAQHTCISPRPWKHLHDQVRRQSAPHLHLPTLMHIAKCAHTQ